MTTITQRIEAATAFARAAWWWLLVIGGAVGALLLVRSCNRADRAESELVRLKEAVELERAGFVVAQRAKAGEVKDALAQVPALQSEIDRLAKALGEKPRVVTVERIVTVPRPAEGTPRPPPATGQTCPACLFAPGDTGQIRVDSAHVETVKGNEIVALAAECWRLTPGPETPILSGTASAPLSHVTVVTPPSRPGWGGGLGGGIATTGPVGSALVVSPPVLGAHLEAAGVVTAGPGLFAAQAALIYRP
jgi:hypothetical protein